MQTDSTWRTAEEILTDMDEVVRQIGDLPTPNGRRYSGSSRQEDDRIDAEWRGYDHQIDSLRFRHDYVLREELLVARMAAAGLGWCSYHLHEAPLASIHTVWVTKWVEARGCDQAGDYFGTDQHSICFDLKPNYEVPKDFSYRTQVPSGAISEVYHEQPPHGFTQCSDIPLYPGFELLERYDIPRPLGQCFAGF